MIQIIISTILEKEISETIIDLKIYDEIFCFFDEENILKTEIFDFMKEHNNKNIIVSNVE